MFFKQRLASPDVLRGTVNVIPSAVVTQAIAAAGADFVMIDREHGPIGPESLHAMIAATAGTRCAPLVRVSHIDEAAVKTALDAGAEGVFYPLVRTEQDAERCVSFVNYPPLGSRGWGPLVAHSRFGVALGDYASEVGPHVACCLFLETAEAVENVDAILAVPGVDLVVIAPFDLSSALGIPGRFDAPEFVDAVATIERAVARTSVALGGVALAPDTAQALRAKGYRVLLQGIDVLQVKDAVAASAGW